MAAYEQLWDVSYEYLEQHATFVNSITSLMLERAKHLRRNLFSNGQEKLAKFQEDFKAAHHELQSMTKTLQTVVNDWKDLFAADSGDYDLRTSAFSSQKMKEEPDNDLTFDYILPTLDYQANQKVKLIVTYIPSTGETGTFYAMDESRKNDFRDNLTPTIKSGKTLINRTPPPGAVFMVYLDNLWNRVVCRESADDKKRLELYLLDLGETLPYEDHVPKAILPAELSKVPAFAIQCALTPKTASLPFQQYDILDFNVIAVENDVLTVEQFVEEQKTPYYAITRDTFTEAELEQLDDISSSTTNAMKAVLGYIPKDDETLCKYYDPVTKDCFKGANCRLRHEPKDPDGWTVERDTVSVAIPAQMEIPLPNTYIMLYPTCVVDVDLFYAQIAGDTENYRRYEQLMSDMNDPESVANYKPCKLMPALGELVIAKYEDVWFRAIVCEVYDFTVSVFYVDYGNTAMVGTSEVRRWEERFKYLPYQAVCCRIANIQRIKPCHLEAMEQLQNYILDQSIKTLIIDNKNPWEVLIYGPDGDDIGKGLIMTKMALPRKPAQFDENSYIPG